MSAAQEFKEFVLRGNVVDLAVGVVIGAAFGAIVKAFVADIMTPLIGLPGKINLGEITFKVHGSIFQVGDFLNTIISFLIIAAVVFFLVVKPINWLMGRNKSDTPTETPTRECPECLSQIPAAAKRCAFCTAELPAAQ